MKATREIDLTLVDAALENNGLTISGPPAARVDRLKRHYATFPDHELAECSECGNASPADDAACSFCGHAGEVDAPEGAIVPAPVQAPEIAVATGDRAEAERQLDAAIARYASANREMVGAGWDMGNAVREIRDRKLYLARRGAGDQPAHRNFEEFCRRELKSSHVHVGRMIAVAENYTREQALAIGATKLSLTLRVAEEQRAPLLAMASDPSVSARQLAEATREAVRDQPSRAAGKDRLGRRLGKRASAPVYPPVAPFLAKAPDAQDAEKKPRKRITLIAEEGDTQVRFYARRSKPGDRRRAFELTDGPVARLPFLNGTQQRIRLCKGEKGIYGLIEFGVAPDEEDEG